MNIVLYHANCADGFAAAFAAWLKFNTTKDGLTMIGMNMIGLNMIPVSYGQPVPDYASTPVPGHRAPGPYRIYILDFSYPREVLMELAAQDGVEKVVVLDHHKTAADQLHGLPDPSMPEKLTARFDMEKSGAVLAWEYFHPGKQVPPVLLYVQDRDLWKWELPWSREINAGIWRGTQRTFDAWNTATRWMTLNPNGAVTMEMEDMMVHEFRAGGDAILRSDALMLDLLAAGAGHQHTTAGLCRVVNSPVLQSELGEKILSDDPLCEYVDIWWDTATARHHSLRSRKGGVDVSAIAAHHGGGGHQSAAGYRRRETIPAQNSTPH